MENLECDACGEYKDVAWTMEEGAVRSGDAKETVVRVDAAVIQGPATAPGVQHPPPGALDRRRGVDDNAGRCSQIVEIAIIILYTDSIARSWSLVPKPIQHVKRWQGWWCTLWGEDGTSRRLRQHANWDQSLSPNYFDKRPR